jgi:glutamate-1-semialdehyde 2,1-aminomutase
VVEAVQRAASAGLSFGAPTRGEVDLAVEICRSLPSIELVRLVNSGTEATMSAIRVARGATGRDKVIKFTGCYHGHADYLLVKSGSGVATLGVPDSLGVPADVARNTLSIEFNDLDALSRTLEAHRAEVACVIVEPVAGNMGCIPPEDGYLQGLRALCTEHGALLIFDEVMTGFRVGAGSAQGRYGVTPDLTCLGKVIGGGMPVGAYGGKREIMEHVAPLGGVYQAGTLSGNPLSVAAGLATLKELSAEGAHQRLEESARVLCEGLRGAARDAGITATVQQVGSMFTLFFGEGPMRRMSDVVACDHKRFSAYFHGMRERGVNLPPSQYEACFLSLAHSADDLSHTVESAREVLADV